MQVSESSTLRLLAQCAADNWELNPSDALIDEKLDGGNVLPYALGETFALPAVVDLTQDSETGGSYSDEESLVEEGGEGAPKWTWRTI